MKSGILQDIFYDYAEIPYFIKYMRIKYLNGLQSSKCFKSESAFKNKKINYNAPVFKIKRSGIPLQKVQFLIRLL